VAARGITFGFCHRENVDPVVLEWVDRVVAYDRQPD